VPFLMISLVNYEVRTRAGLGAAGCSNLGHQLQQDRMCCQADSHYDDGGEDGVHLQHQQHDHDHDHDQGSLSLVRGYDSSPSESSNFRSGP
jgi:hypothetical protein